MGEELVTERWARQIMLAAIEEHRCADVLNCLFDGGSVTVDAVTGKIALATAAQLNAMWNRPPDDTADAASSGAPAGSPSGIPEGSD